MTSSARLLRLLGLLQRRQLWSAADLADRLEITERTVRRDVDKLRSLGYPVHATAGSGGGYRLGAGAELPPLLLDDDEAVAVAVGLRVAALGAVAGIGEAATQASAKLERVLPARLRPLVAAVSEATVPVTAAAATVDAELLVGLATACREHTRVRFDYRTRDGRSAYRRVEPHRLVTTGTRWYLVARDEDRVTAPATPTPTGTDRVDPATPAGSTAAPASGASAGPPAEGSGVAAGSPAEAGWRTFRVDRITSTLTAAGGFAPAADPPDAAELVRAANAVAPYRVHARVRMFVPLAEAATLVPPTVGLLTAEGDGVTRLDTGADSLDFLALHLGLLPCRIEVLGPPVLREHLTVIAARLTAATEPARS